MWRIQNINGNSSFGPINWRSSSIVHCRTKLLYNNTKIFHCHFTCAYISMSKRNVYPSYMAVYHHIFGHLWDILPPVMTPISSAHFSRFPSLVPHRYLTTFRGRFFCSKHLMYTGWQIRFSVIISTVGSPHMVKLVIDHVGPIVPEIH